MIKRRALGHKLGESCGQLPACSVDNVGVGIVFKLSVQVHAATVLSLGEPGHVVKLGVAFGDERKEMEIADFVLAPDPVLFTGESPVDDSKWEDRAATPTRKAKPRQSGSLFTVSEPTCGTTLPFRMSPAPSKGGDTFTFSGHVHDLLAGGLRLRLCAHDDVRSGPWHVELPRPQELGEAVIDLRRRVLPACAPLGTTRGSKVHDQIVIDGVGGFGGKLEKDAFPPWWETPVLMVPLTHVSDYPHNGVEVSIIARVALSFSINIDPEQLLHEADYAERSLVDRMDSIVDGFFPWMAMPFRLPCSLGLESLPCSQDIDRATAADAYIFPRPLPSTARPWSSESEEPVAEVAPAHRVPLAADWAYKL